MSRAAIARVMVLVSLVALLSGTVAGQSSTKKPAKKRPAPAAPAPATPAPKPAPATDVRIRTRYTSGAQVSENTTYLKGSRQRVEFPGAVSIEQCDLGRTVLINPTAKTYLVTEHHPKAAAATPPAAAAGDPAPAQGQQTTTPSKGGVVTFVTTLNDTGERKQMFGREARHVVTTMTKEASASACDKSTLTVEVDGWYTDFPGPQCPVASAPKSASQTPNACVDRVESRTTGEAKLGFPLSTKTTTRAGAGETQETVVSSMEVTAFEMTTLDAALFDVPAGYSAASGSAQMMAGFQETGGIDNALLGSTADGTSNAAPKTAGVVRVGVLEPIDKSSHKLPTRELRQELTGAFGKPPFEALTLAGSSVTEAQADAARMQCDYVLVTEIADIKTSKPGRVGGMLKKVTRDGPPRDVHDVTLAYRLYPVGANDPAVSDIAKASSGGGFSIHSALRLAMVAGSLYLRFSGLGLLNPMLSNFGGGLGPLAGTGLFDPRASAMSSLTQLFMATGPEDGGDGTASSAAADPEAVIRQTVDAALANEARGAIEHLQKPKKQ